MSLLDIDRLNPSAKKDYYEQIRKQLLQNAGNNSMLSYGQKGVPKIYSTFRGFPVEYEGIENIPADTPVLFVCNHSNSKDGFTASEMFAMLQRPGSVMVATDCLNTLSTRVFKTIKATTFDRRNPAARVGAPLEMAGKMLGGMTGALFGESTWNLHPTLPAHNIRLGAPYISTISGYPMIPTIFEYIENDGFIKSESDLYKKLIIRFGEPILVTPSDSLTEKADLLTMEMTRMRQEIWSDYGIIKTFDYIDPRVYVNHTLLKKFTFGFTYNSREEQKFLYFRPGQAQENEWTIKDGIFQPGITDKKLTLKEVKALRVDNNNTAA